MFGRDCCLCSFSCLKAITTVLPPRNQKRADRMFRRRYILVMVTGLVVVQILWTLFSFRDSRQQPALAAEGTSSSTVLGDKDETEAQLQMSVGEEKSQEGSGPLRYTSQRPNSEETHVHAPMESNAVEANPREGNDDDNSGGDDDDGVDGDDEGPMEFSTPEVPDHEVNPDKDNLRNLTQRLLKVFKYRYANMKVNADNMAANVSCPAKFQERTPPCYMEDCHSRFPQDLEERLRRMLAIQQTVLRDNRAVIRSMTDQDRFVEFTFVTAASANHFDESQGLVKSLHQHVFPFLKKRGLKGRFRLFYYDLGLKPEQLQKLKKNCGCTVLPFPFDRLLPHFRRLKSCVWKPLILKAHLNASRYTIWMDTSLRWKTEDIIPILSQANRFGLFLARNEYMTLMHVHPKMLDFFQIDRCLLASFYEVAGGFVVLHNNDFVHKAILDPWVGCAFSKSCLCPQHRFTDNCEKFVDCKSVRYGYDYFRCHRFDQSGLALILFSLFDWRVTALTHHLVDNTVTEWFDFRRGEAVNFFP